jgi:formylglycine-generating enzyme required for sulfatase activity
MRLILILSLSLLCLQTWPAQAGEVIRDCPECPDMVVIPAGRFLMGSQADEVGRFANEGPQHDVHVPGFALAKTEVTRAQFAAFVAATGYQAGSSCFLFENGRFKEYQGKTWRDPGFAQTDNDPVACVDWDDAQAYVAWLSRRTGQRYRLPSEAEWEYAARAGSATARPWGDSADQACTHANVMDATGKRQIPGVNWEAHPCSDGYAWTAPVASYQANAFGLYDMIGNLWEWTQDCWNDSYRNAPVDGSAWMSGDCGKHVLRGSSWLYSPTYARSAYRDALIAADRDVSFTIRPAREITPSRGTD